MVDLVTLNFPKKSHRKIVVIPRDSALLAEFFGIMMGDGGINNPWQANVTLNTIEDRKYALFVEVLIGKLFAVIPRVMHRKNQKATIVSVASMTIVEFLVSKGLRQGNKLAQGLIIPDWILSKKAYKMACVRGLVDTDGCLVLHRHTIRGKTYSNLYLSFSSGSRELLEQVAVILFESGIEPHFAGNGRELWLYSKQDVEKYMLTIGSSNHRLLDVYKTWRDG